METDSKQQRVARTLTFSVLQRLHRAAESQNKDTQRRRIRRLHAIRVGGGPFEGLQLGGGLEPDRIGRRRHGTVTVRTARVHRSVLGRVPVRVGVRVDSVREGVRVGRKEVPGRQEVRAQGGTADEQWRATATPRAATTRPAARPSGLAALAAEMYDGRSPGATCATQGRTAAASSSYWPRPPSRPGRSVATAAPCAVLPAVQIGVRHALSRSRSVGPAARCAPGCHRVPPRMQPYELEAAGAPCGSAARSTAAPSGRP